MKNLNKKSIKPKIEDYETGGTMIAPYGGYDYESYSKALEEYIIVLESLINKIKT
jgi:hypothetical protein